MKWSDEGAVGAMMIVLIIAGVGAGLLFLWCAWFADWRIGAAITTLPVGILIGGLFGPKE